MRIQGIMDIRNRYKIVYKNYNSIIWNTWRGKNKIKLTLQNGDSIYVDNHLVWLYTALIPNKNIYIHDLPPDSDSIQFTYNGKSIKLKGGVGAIGDV